MQVVEDILKQLSLRSPVATFKVPCFRSNLYYDVVFSDTMEDPCEDLKEFIDESLEEYDSKTKPVSPFFLNTLMYVLPYDVSSLVCNLQIVINNSRIREAVALYTAVLEIRLKN